MSKNSLYERLGGYDALTAVANDLLPRLQGDPQLGRFWKNRSDLTGPHFLDTRALRSMRSEFPRRNAKKLLGSCSA